MKDRIRTLICDFVYEVVTREGGDFYTSAILFFQIYLC